MKFLRMLFLFALFAGIASAQAESKILQFKHRIVFSDAKETLVAQKIFDDDRQVVFVGVKTIQFWDLINGTLLASYRHEIPKLDKVDAALVFSPDASKVIALDSFTWRLIRKEKKVTASVYDLRTGKLITNLERPNESIREAEWSENGATLVTYNGSVNDKRTEVCFWNGDDFKFRGAVLLKGYINYKKLQRDGKVFLAKADNSDSYQFVYDAADYLRAWDTQTAQPIQTFSSGGDRQGSFFAGNLTESEKYAVMSAGNYAKQRVSVWRVGGGESPIYEIFPQKKGGSIDLLGIADDYFFLYQNKTIEMRDAADGKLKLSIPNQKRFAGNFRSFRLSPDEKTLVIDDCEQADFFDAANGRKKFTIDLVCKTDFDLVSTSYRDFDVLRFQPNGNLLLTSSDKTLRLWNADDGRLLQVLADPNRIKNIKKDSNKDDGLGSQARWRRNGKFAFAPGADRKSILIWEAANQSEKMKILITGANGMLAQAAFERCRGLGDAVVALTRQELDIGDGKAVGELLKREKFDGILNCAAYTNVDGAETNEKICYQANAEGVENLARAAKEINAAFVTVSTDYVFDGANEGFYTQHDTPNPQGVYAASKLEGEVRARSVYARSIVVRSGWIYGANGTNFLSVMNNLLAAGKSIKVIGDSYGTPTYAVDLAKRLRELLELDLPNIYHVANAGAGTSYEGFARKAAEIKGYDQDLIESVSHTALERPAPRPVSSKLACLFSEKFGLAPMRDWEIALQEFLK